MPERPAAVDGIAVVATDVTELANAQARRRSREPREGRVPGDAGHELRNPLAPILTALQLMRCATGPEAEQGARRHRAPGAAPGAPGRRPARRLADHARQDRAERERVELAELVAKAIEMASPLLEERRHNLHRAMCRERADRRWRRRPRLSQVVAEPADQCREVHRARRPDRRSRRAGTATTSSCASRTTASASAEMLPHIFDLFVQEPAGARPVAGRARPRADDRPEPGRAARRQRRGAQRRRRPRQRLRRPLPAAQRRRREGPRDPSTAAARGPRHSRRSSSTTTTTRRRCSPTRSEDVRLRGADGRATAPRRSRSPSQFQPHVALLDIGLPVMDGYEVAERLRTLAAPA